MIKIAILGFGTVGSGVYEVIETNFNSISKKAGAEISVKYILDKREFEGHEAKNLFTKDFDQILSDPEVEIIVEVMGGINPAYSFVKSAIQAGKSAVTSNKELVAKHGAELLDLARDNGVNFLFEASVGGGIPIIRPLNQSLTADEIYQITGILNGTTNYMLTKMTDEGLTFDSVLKDAQQLGYAEANPDADVLGHDACRKIAILSSLAYGMHVDFEDIYTEGITKITQEDIIYAKTMNSDIKLLANSVKKEDKVFAYVAPTIIPKSHILSNVNGVFNGIFVKGNVIGDVMFYGSGAGKLPTASAVVADVIDAAKHKGTNIVSFWSTEKLALGNIGSFSTQMLVRLENKEGIKEKINQLFGDVAYIEAGFTNEIAFVTKELPEATISNGIASLGEEATVINQLRVTK